MNRPNTASGQEPTPRRRDAAELARWRTAERERLIAARRMLDDGEHRIRSARIAAQLDRRLGDVHGRRLAVYWPVRGEPDLRPWIEQAAARGATFALPVVVGPDRPLEFRAWALGGRLEPGVWKIQVPAEGDAVVPDVVLVPLVGFDRAGHRLGYGGGYYDRTLAALSPRPRVIGVGFASACLPTIEPQPHDVPMDAIVTEDEVIERPDGSVE